MSSNATSGSGSGGSGDSAVPRKSKKPKYSKFTQQELPACKPILTPGWVITTFILVSVVFIPIGLGALFASRDAVEIVDRYDDACIPPSGQSDKVKYIQTPGNKSCTRTIVVSKHMKAPIYVYYQLDNFYQNHRRYVKSRSDSQLRYNSSASEVSTCKPENMANGKVVVPCGLIAWSLFNDTYSFTMNSKNVSVNKTGISWASDRNHKFGKDVYPTNFQNGSLKGGATLNSTIPLSDQEDLIVWMRTAALPSFRKMYGRIEQDLEVNDTITVTVMNQYNTYSFDGKKKLVLSTTTWLGGKNSFLGVAYLVVGGICFFLAMLFALVYLVKGRQLGDTRYLSWNTPPN